MVNRRRVVSTKKRPRKKRPRRAMKSFPPKLFVLSLVLNICFLGFVGWQILWGDFAAAFKVTPKTSTPAGSSIPAAPEKSVSPSEPIFEKAWRLVSGEVALTEDQPKLVFVIDDMGHSRQNEPYYQALEDQLTYAILPFLEYSEYFAKLGHKYKCTVMLHLPLEAADHTFPGPGLITSRMSEANVRDLLARNLEEVPYRAGANSHMGSKGTTDARLMKIILSELKKRKMFFLDSYTTAESVAGAVAKEVGIPMLKRDVFLDNVDEQDQIKKRVIELAATAKTSGYAIGIGHDRHSTLAILADLIPQLEKDGFEVVGLGPLVKFLEKHQKLPV